MPDAGTFSPTIAMARNRWRGAEDRLYPTLISDPGSYQRSINQVQAVVAELRKRCTGVEDIIAVEAAPEELIAAALPGGSIIPADLLVGVACGMADREISADVEGRRRQAAIEEARAAGQAWVVVAGPADIEDLTDGRRPELHIATGILIETAVDPWSGEDPFQLQVTAGETGELLVTGTFADRGEWLAEVARQRVAVESGTVGG